VLWPSPPTREQIILKARLPLTPVPKGRPRVPEHGRPYTPAATRQFEQAAGYLLRAASRGVNSTDRLGLWAEFYTRGNGDIDNYVKAVLDAGNGVAWGDDRQFDRIVADVARASTAPRIDVVVWVVRTVAPAPAHAAARGTGRQPRRRPAAPPGDRR
jgi:Holliday junction resolvase RusA-like endonuclease